MFRKLRLKFCLMVSGITFLILFLICLTLNVSLSVTTENRLLGQAEVAWNSENDAGEGVTQEDAPPHEERKKEMLPRFFAVTKTNDSFSFSSVRDFPFSQEELSSLAKEAFSASKDHGFLGYFYYYRFETKAVFLDARSEKESLQNTFTISSSISGAAFLGISLSSYFLSKPVVKPYERLYASQRRFLTDASHELKTPLAIIGTNLEVLDGEYPGNNWIRSSLEQSERMNHLILSMISLNKIEELSGNFKKAPFDISNALTEAATGYESLSISKKIRLNLDIPCSPVIYDGNEEFLFKLFGIMLDNAYKYVSEEGQINVSLKDERKKIIIVFGNSVNELDMEKLSHCFERFYTCSDSRNRASCGFGIGLSIAKAIVEGHNGEIKVIPWKEEKGLSFYISLKK